MFVPIRFHDQPAVVAKTVVIDVMRFARRIGAAGCFVGHAVAKMVSRQGIPTERRYADFSNTNESIGIDG